MMTKPFFKRWKIKSRWSCITKWRILTISSFLMKIMIFDLLFPRSDGYKIYKRIDQFISIIFRMSRDRKNFYDYVMLEKSDSIILKAQFCRRSRREQSTCAFLNDQVFGKWWKNSLIILDMTEWLIYLMINWFSSFILENFIDKLYFRFLHWFDLLQIHSNIYIYIYIYIYIWSIIYGFLNLLRRKGKSVFHEMLSYSINVEWRVFTIISFWE